MAPPHNDRAPFQQHRWVECFNAGGQEIPSFGVVEITGAQTVKLGRIAVNGQRPSETDLTDVAVNGHSPIPVGKSGQVTFSYPAYALYNNASTPAFGENWGTEAGAFTLKKNNSGFGIVGNELTAPDRVFVVRATGTDDIIFQFTLNEDMAGGSADADILTLGGAELDPEVDADVLDNAGLWTHALDGAKGLAIKIGDEYHILESETKARFIRFALTQDMATTDPATRTATKQDFWDGQDPGTITSVENLDASANQAYTGASGDMGVARLDEIDDVYRIVSMEDPVNGDEVWLSYVKAGNKVVHLQPSTDTDAADSGTTHLLVLTSATQFQFDDAGHLMGMLLTGTWTSPWGFDDPT